MIATREVFVPAGHVLWVNEQSGWRRTDLPEAPQWPREDGVTVDFLGTLEFAVLPDGKRPEEQVPRLKAMRDGAERILAEHDAEGEAT